MKALKKISFAIAFSLFCALLFSMACSDSGKNEAQQSLDKFNAYVRVHVDSSDAYLDRNWDDLEAEYSEVKADADRHVGKMNAEMKESFEKSKADWEVFKNKYTEKKEARVRIKKTLVPDELNTGGSDDFSNVNGKNVLQAYEHFVKTVKKHKDEYSKEDWIMVNDCWKSLNQQKKNAEKEIPVKTDAKILKLKVQYEAIQAVNRPFAESTVEKRK